jgi:predicted component of type VI protein secretion system
MTEIEQYVADTIQKITCDKMQANKSPSGATTREIMLAISDDIKTILNTLCESGGIVKTGQTINGDGIYIINGL